MYKPINKLSPSKIKTFSSCSQVYTAKYLWKVPDKSNSGAVLGSLTHDISELLLNKDKYYDYVNKIVETKKFPTGLLKLIDKKLKKTEYYSKENFKLVKSFLLVVFNNDFWMEGGDLKKPEEDFTIEKEYKIGGFIDKYGLYFDGQDYFCVVIDYKSQREKFLEEELNFNLQAFTYLLAVKQKHPEINLFKSCVKFILLRYPEDPIQKFQLKHEKDIEGFEEYLNYVQIQIDNFKESDNKSNLAADLGYTKPGFEGLVKCGRASFAGELKKDGSPMWYCPLKFKFNYYVLVDKDGKIKYSASTKEELASKTTNDLKLEERVYLGCPSHNKKNNIKFYKK
jgi:hypothetical protein